MRVENMEDIHREKLNLVKQALQADFNDIVMNDKGEFKNFPDDDMLYLLVMKKLFKDKTHSGNKPANLLEDGFTAKAQIEGHLRDVELVYFVNPAKEDNNYYAVNFVSNKVNWS